MRPVHGLAVLALCAGAPALCEVQSAGPYLCISAKATGFAFDRARGAWDTARFEAGRKYIVRRVIDGQYKSSIPGAGMTKLNAAWAVWDFGNDAYPIASCAQDFSDQGGIYCESNGTTFMFSRTSGRFLRSYVIGYTSPPGGFEFLGTQHPEGSDTPVMEIGTCSALQ